MEIDRRQELAPAAKATGVSTLGAILAVLVGVVLGLGVLLYVRNARLERRAALDMADASMTVATLPPATLDASVAALMVVDLDDVTATAPDADVHPNEVTLRVPGGARIFVDGQALPTGITSVARPDAGVITVLVKAEGHEDAIVELRPTSSDEIEVPMVEKPKAKPRPQTTPHADSDPTLAMPPNPYD